MNFKPRRWLAAVMAGGSLALAACGTVHYTQPSDAAQYASWWNRYGKTENSAFSSSDKQIAEGLAAGTLSSSVNADVIATQLTSLPQVYLSWPMPPVDPADWRKIIVGQGKVGTDIMDMNYTQAEADLATVNSSLKNFILAVAQAQ